MKVRFLAIIVICIAALLGAVACDGGGGKAPNGMTGAEILTMSQNTAINSMQFSATIESGMMGEKYEMSMSGAMDEAARAMNMNMVSADIFDSTVQMYMLDGWLYMTDIDSGTGWIKTRLTEDIWQEQHPTAQQMELMKDFIKAKYIGMENIAGLNCYKIDVEPNWDAILRATDMEETDFYSTEEIIDMIKDTKCVFWVAEGSYYPVQMFFSMIIEMEFLGQKFSITMDMTMTFSDINQPVIITLPAAALSATEISYEDFMYEDW